MASDHALPEDIKLRHETAAENPLDWKWERVGLAGHIASAGVKLMKTMTNLFFQKRYGHRVVMLETVAAVPGMVAAMFNHLSSLRKFKHDSGRIRTMLDEAENERMHLMTFIQIAKPTVLDRALIMGAQAMFLTAYSLVYVVNKQAAHRFVGMIEEEAVKSYTDYIAEVDKGNVRNVDAPEIAKKYWNLPRDAKLRDVLVAVRNDEMEHRDVNHRWATDLARLQVQRKKERQEKIKNIWNRLAGRKPKAEGNKPPAPKAAPVPAPAPAAPKQ